MACVAGRTELASAHGERRPRQTAYRPSSAQRSISRGDCAWTETGPVFLLQNIVSWVALAACFWRERSLLRAFGDLSPRHHEHAMTSS
jgi:hypothetical protein